MTDYERFKEAFESVGIAFELTDKNEDGNAVLIEMPQPGGHHDIEVCFTFDKDGKFVNVVARE